MKRDIHLTASEQKQFAQCSQNLREGWNVLLETQESYESLRQIAMRYQLADFSMNPEMKILAEKIEKGESLVDFSVEDLPESAQEEIYFVLGARGVNAIIQSILPTVKTDDDVEALAVLSTIRNKLLEINSTATYR